MRAWYLKKEWIDREEEIEAVHLHYSCTLGGKTPNWEQPHPRWPMAQAGQLFNGIGRASGQNDRSLAQAELLDQAGSDHAAVRQHILQLPLQIWDAEREEWTANYALHYFHEVFQGGRRWASEVFTDEIVYRDLEYVDWEGRLSGVAIFWSVSGWEAPVWVPAEDVRFLDAFGGGHERCAGRFYQFGDKARFAFEKWNLMKQLPLPWRWTGRIYGPKGTVVRQRWHTGNLSPGMNWEDWDPHPPGDFVHFL